MVYLVDNSVEHIYVVGMELSAKIGYLLASYLNLLTLSFFIVQKF